jgi:hypothetical protein
MSPEGTRELANCWMTVANLGGAVGFPFPPVSLDEVRTVADLLIADLDPEYSQLLLARVGSEDRPHRWADFAPRSTDR